MKRLTIEEKVQRTMGGGNTPLGELAKRIDLLIRNNLEEALQSKVEYIRKKAEQLKEK